MSDIYTSLHVSPKKKRSPTELDDDLLTPKKLRTAPPTPPSTVTRRRVQPKTVNLPDHLARLYKIQTALQHALSHALATCGVSPSEDTGIVRNVLNHHTLPTYSGFDSKFSEHDLRRLCWLWEWDGKSLVSSPRDEKKKDAFEEDDDDNPFLDKPKPGPSHSQQDDDNPFLDKPKAESSPSKDWQRGAMGFILSQTTYVSKSTGTRVPTYGIGIEVEMDIDKGLSGGMAAVARWTAAGEKRKKELLAKLQRWMKLNEVETPIPNVPFADLPALPGPAKASTLTKLLAASSPKSPSAKTILEVPSSPTRSPTRSLSKSPTKKRTQDFAIPFPITPSSRLNSPSKSDANTIVFPQTPSSRHRADSSSLLHTPTSARTPTSSLNGRMTPTGVRTPTSSLGGRSTPSLSDGFATPTLRARISSFLMPGTPSSSASSSRPSTPVHQRSDSIPSTPTSTARRQALYERVRQKSLTSTPIKGLVLPKDATPKAASMTRDELLRLSQEELRRRCILSRLGDVAESVWTLFSAPSTSSAGASAGTGTRKRGAMRVADVAEALVKSSKVPISAAEARESLEMLANLCPFFIRPLNIAGDEWLEMPAPASASSTAGEETKTGSTTIGPGSPSKMKPQTKAGTSKVSASPSRIPVSPGRKKDSAEELLTRSPRTVKREAGGLREVRERIRREIELQDL